MSQQQFAIIGGGISGLAAAWYASRRGVHPVVFEENPRFGGLIRTEQLPYGDFEAGPDSFIAAKPALVELANELGIADRLISSNDAQRRVYIGCGGRLVRMPKGMVMMSPADLGTAMRSQLFSIATKVGFVRELLQKPRIRAGDVTLSDFVTEHFGKQVLDVIAEPLMMGVYGGEVGELSMQAVLPRFLDYEQRYGSVIRATRHERRASSGAMFRSFAGGMQTVIDALTTGLKNSAELRTNAPVEEIRREADGWRVGGETFERVILAVPAFKAAGLMRDVDETAAKLLDEIPYSSAILTTFAFNASECRALPGGFGFLIPRGERKTLAAATFIATKFPERIREGFCAIRCFIVGSQADSLAETPDAGILARALEDLKRWTGVNHEPIHAEVQRWPKSMPQYRLGHLARVERLRERIAEHPGLQLCGNAYRGVGIPDAVTSAREAVEAVLD